jgi:hypothetical protein
VNYHLITIAILVIGIVFEIVLGSTWAIAFFPIALALEMTLWFRIRRSFRGEATKRE